MKKISILALVIILTASLAGCWRRKPVETTMPSTSAPMPSTSAPSVAPTTAPTVPSTNGTIPNPGNGTEGTEGLLPGMDDPTGHTGGDSAPTDSTVDNQARSIPRY